MTKIAAGMPRATADAVLHVGHLFGRKPVAPPVDLAGRTFVVTGATTQDAVPPIAW